MKNLSVRLAWMKMISFFKKLREMKIRFKREILSLGIKIRGNGIFTFSFNMRYSAYGKTLITHGTL